MPDKAREHDLRTFCSPEHRLLDLGARLLGLDRLDPPQTLFERLFGNLGGSAETKAAPAREISQPPNTLFKRLFQVMPRPGTELCEDLRPHDRRPERRLCRAVCSQGFRNPLAPLRIEWLELRRHSKPDGIDPAALQSRCQSGSLSCVPSS